MTIKQIFNHEAMQRKDVERLSLVFKWKINYIKIVAGGHFLALTIEIRYILAKQYFKQV